MKGNRDRNLVGASKDFAQKAKQFREEQEERQKKDSPKSLVQGARDFAEAAKELREKQEERARQEKAALENKKLEKEKGKVLPNGKERNEKVQEWLQDRSPQVYQDAVALRDRIKSLLDNEELIHQKETYDAAKRVVSQLDVSIKKWEQVVKSNLVIRKKDEGVFQGYSFNPEIGPLTLRDATQVLLNESVAVIQDNKQAMMKDPGWWNQIKAQINDFLEKNLPSIGPIFDVKETHFGIDADIQKGMDDLENPKNLTI